MRGRYFWVKIKKFVSLSLLVLFLQGSLLFISSASGGSGSKSWEYNFEENYQAHDLCTDSDNVYACGIKVSNVSTGETNILLTQLGKNGTHIFTKLWKKEDIQWASSIVFDGIYLYTAGYIKTEISRELLMIKWDIDGTEVWNKTYQDYFHIESQSLVYHNNCLYLCGSEDHNGNDAKLKLFAFDTGGNVLWNKTIIHPLDDPYNHLSVRGYSVCVLDDFIYTSGEFEEEHDSGDYYIVKWDMEGNQIWTKIWGTSNREKLVDIQPFHQDLVICGHYTTDTSSFTYIAKMNSEGDIIWENFYDEEDRNYPNCLDVDESNDPEIVIGGAIHPNKYTRTTFLTSWSQDGDSVDAGSASGTTCIDIVKENAIIFVCLYSIIAAFDGIPPLKNQIPGFSIGIVALVCLLITTAIVRNIRKSQTTRLKISQTNSQKNR